ncbi:protein YABBY 7-like isoform X2 [Wolffia australiana]
MSTCSSLFDLSEQLCYVQCGFCTTILLVSVPCCSLSKVVTVRCGHCEGLLSVDMGSVPLVPWQLLSSLEEEELSERKEFNHNMHEDHGHVEVAAEEEVEGEQDEGEEYVPITMVVNKPPEKRQRAPSAYNCFIKEEIKRIKGRDPSITHKEAFSTAAKNWAHFPRIQHKGHGESCSLGFEELMKEPAGAKEGLLLAFLCN